MVHTHALRPRPIDLAVVFLSVGLFFACRARESVPEMSITQAQEALTDSVMAIPGVTGIGIGECEGIPCIKVMVEQMSDALKDKIPATYEGFPVVVEESGVIEAHEE